MRTPDEILNCKGLNCPLPILHTKKVMDRMVSGQILELVSDADGIAEDVPRWCKRRGNQLIEFTRDGQVFKFYIEKA